MNKICSTCGLPSDICVCKQLAKEQLRIKVRTEIRKFGKKVTIITGLLDSRKLNKKLKVFCACGGSHKNKRVLLQGDQRTRVREFLIKEGYSSENIEVI